MLVLGKRSYMVDVHTKTLNCWRQKACLIMSPFFWLLILEKRFRAFKHTYTHTPVHQNLS